MKKLLYLSAAGDLKTLIGVRNKIKHQTNFFEDNDIEVTHLDISLTNKSLWSKMWKRMPFTGIRNWHIDKNTIKNNDIIYIRYAFSDFQFIKFLKNAKKINPQILILLEIPTYPYDLETSNTIKKGHIKIKDWHNRNKMHRYIDYVLTYSKDEEIFKIKTVQISNFVNTELILLKRPSENANTAINIIAVANFNYWHGYDRFLIGLYEYYKNNNDEKRKIVLHLVGDGKELIEYKDYVNKHDLVNNVIFYGLQQDETLNEIYNDCELALDSMGRHRSKVYYNSSLKGKEYGARGLPIVSGVKTELDFDENYPYYFRVPADNTSISIEDVIDFYDSIYDSSLNTKIEVSNYIRQYTIKRFGIDIELRKVTDVILNDEN